MGNKKNKQLGNWIITDCKRVSLINAQLRAEAIVILSFVELMEKLKGKSRPISLLVSAELDWDDYQNWTSGFPGYHLLEKVLMNPDILIPPMRIVFASHFSRDELAQTHQNQHHQVTYRFVHFTYQTLPSSFAQLPMLGIRKFHFIQKYCLLEGGIMDWLSHAIRSFLHNEDYGPRLDRKVREVLRYAELIGRHNQKICADLLQESDENARRSLLLSLQAGLLRRAKLKRAEDFRIDEYPRLPYNLLLVEDENGPAIKAFFEPFFAEIQLETSGKAALEILQTSGKHFQAVLIDMELRGPDGFPQEIEGTDILEACEAMPGIATRVISGLPKTAIKMLSGKPGEHILHKSDQPDEQISSAEDLGHFLQKIREDIENRQAYTGPENGHLSKPFAKAWLIGWRQTIYEPQMKDAFRSFHDLWKSVYQIADSFFVNGHINDHIDTTMPSRKNLSLKTIRERIHNILVHRLIVLGESQSPTFGIERDRAKRRGEFVFAFDSDFQQNYDDGFSYYPCFRGKLQTGKPNEKLRRYLDTDLGLNYEPVSESRQISLRNSHGDILVKKIKQINLFEEEKTWLEKFSPSRKLEFRDEFPNLFRIIQDAWSEPIDCEKGHQEIFSDLLKISSEIADFNVETLDKILDRMIQQHQNPNIQKVIDLLENEMELGGSIVRAEEEKLGEEIMQKISKVAGLASI